MEKRYQCYNCFLILSHDVIDEDGNCPICHQKVLEMCELDRVCICNQDMNGGVIYCSKCGRPTCKCGAHNVLVWSRVTGYLQDIAGFNSAKYQEVKDRHRTENAELY